jgi:hypothetical protein
MNCVNSRNITPMDFSLKDIKYLTWRITSRESFFLLFLLWFLVIILLLGLKP